MVSIRALILVSNNVENPAQLGRGGGGVGETIVGSEFSDEASIHKVQFFKGLVHFQL